MDAKEGKIPVTLLSVGLASILSFALFAGGLKGITAVLLPLFVQTVVGVSVLLLACFVAGRLLNISFGSLPTAILKLTAIFIFTYGAAVWLLAWASLYLVLAVLLAVFLIFYILLAWLFELEGSEPLQVAVICLAAGVISQFLLAIGRKIVMS